MTNDTTLDDLPQPEYEGTVAFNDLHVHHVQPIATYDSPEDANELPNLITLCRPHHAKYEGIPLEVNND